MNELESLLLEALVCCKLDMQEMRLEIIRLNNRLRAKDKGDCESVAKTATAAPAPDSTAAAP